MVVVVVVRAAGGGVEGGDAAEVEDEVLPVAHGRGVVLVSREPHWRERRETPFRNVCPTQGTACDA